MHLVRVNGREHPAYQMVAIPLVDKLLATPLHQPDMVVEMDMAAVAERPVVGV